jgi:hypothetical protein
MTTTTVNCMTITTMGMRVSKPVACEQLTVLFVSASAAQSAVGRPLS